VFSTSVAPFVYVDAASKIALAVAVGLLVGLEREWAQKAVGVRTFAIIALLGTLTYMVAPQLLIPALCGTFLLVILLNVHHLLKNWQLVTADSAAAPGKTARESVNVIDRDAPLEITTSVALLVTLMLGALIGQGHYFTAIASAIVMTMLLAWKEGLSRFAGGLQPEEIRSAVLLGLLTFVIYPLLPDSFIDPMDLLNPRQSWLIVVVIAGLGFANYVMLRFYGTRGTYYAAFLGGLVNSTAAATELSGLFKGVNNSSLAVAVVMITSVAMFIRNLVILAIFAPAAVGTALLPLLAMALAALGAVWMHHDRDGTRLSPLSLSSPVSMPHVLKFAAVFVALAATGTLAQRYFGTLGFLALSVAGGLVSSASTTATAATLAAAGKITPDAAGMAAVLTSMASAVVDMPIVYRQIRDSVVFYRLAGVSVLVLVIGLSVMTLGQSESHAIQRLALETIQRLRPPAQ
jgi:uncharacterized membrane protein (DUF4010 family)